MLFPISLLFGSQTKKRFAHLCHASWLVMLILPCFLRCIDPNFDNPATNIYPEKENIWITVFPTSDQPMGYAQRMEGYILEQTSTMRLILAREVWKAYSHAERNTIHRNILERFGNLIIPRITQEFGTVPQIYRKGIVTVFLAPYLYAGKQHGEIEAYIRHNDLLANALSLDGNLGPSNESNMIIVDAQHEYIDILKPGGRFYDHLAHELSHLVNLRAKVFSRLKKNQSLTPKLLSLYKSPLWEDEGLAEIATEFVNMIPRTRWLPAAQYIHADPLIVESFNDIPKNSSHTRKAPTAAFRTYAQAYLFYRFVADLWGIPSSDKHSYAYTIHGKSPFSMLMKNETKHLTSINNVDYLIKEYPLPYIDSFFDLYKHWLNALADLHLSTDIDQYEKIPYPYLSLSHEDFPEGRSIYNGLDTPNLTQKSSSLMETSFISWVTDKNNTKNEIIKAISDNSVLNKNSDGLYVHSVSKGGSIKTFDLATPQENKKDNSKVTSAIFFINWEHKDPAIFRNDTINSKEDTKRITYEKLKAQSPHTPSQQNSIGCGTGKS